MDRKNSYEGTFTARRYYQWMEAIYGYYSASNAAYLRQSEAPLLWEAFVH